MAREFSRQAFLRGALGAATTGALSVACRSTATQGTDVPSATPVPTTSRAPAGPPDWASLEVQGRVTLPSNPEFAAAKAVFNARFDDSTPAAVVAVATVGDVRKAGAQRRALLHRCFDRHRRDGDRSAATARPARLRREPQARHDSRCSTT